MTHRPQKQVREFHDTVNLESFDVPQIPNEALMNLSIRLIEEEFDEWIEAYERDDLVGMIDGLVDLIYVCYGAAIRMGIDVEPFFDEVHRSNMTKGKGKINHYGKLEKPDSYSPADIKNVLERIIKHV